MPTISPEPLHPGFQKLVDAMAESPEWQDLTIPEIRRVTQVMRQREATLTGITRHDLTLDLDGYSLAARLYVPDGTSAIGPGLVYFHGGGFSIGSIDTHEGLVERLALASGVKILSVEYRLAPEHPFPAAHDDAVASARWAFDHAEAIGFDRNFIALGGDSAGANLAASACLDLRADTERNVCFQLLFYPNTTVNDIPGSRDVYQRGYFLTLPAAHHLFRQYVTPAQARDPRVDLLHRDDLSGLPPTFFTVGHCDILFDECVAYAEAMEAAGVDVKLVTYPGYIHSFYGFFAPVPAVLSAFAEAGAALAQGLKSKGLNAPLKI